MPIINGRYYANPAYGRAIERARQREQFGGTRPARAGNGARARADGHWVTIAHRHVLIDEARAGQDRRGNEQIRHSRIELTARVLIGGIPYSSGSKGDAKQHNDVVQPPAFLDINMAPAERLARGLYKVRVSLTRDTRGQDNGKVIDVEIEPRVNDVQGTGGSLKGVQQLPVETSEIPLTVAISARHGDPGYEGPAKLNVMLSGPSGSEGRLSIRVHVEKGNRGAPTVVGRSGGRTLFIVPE